MGKSLLKARDTGLSNPPEMVQTQQYVLSLSITVELKGGVSAPPFLFREVKLFNAKYFQIVLLIKLGPAYSNHYSKYFLLSNSNTNLYILMSRA